MAIITSILNYMCTAKNFYQRLHAAVQQQVVYPWFNLIRNTIPCNRSYILQHLCHNQFIFQKCLLKTFWTITSMWQQKMYPVVCYFQRSGWKI